MKTITKIVYAGFGAFMLAWFALLPQARAVTPAPDGCYPNFTTAEGCGALNALTTGQGNTGIGWRSLFFNSIGGFNTAIGAGALLVNNADENTATGVGALLSNTAGIQNTANGALALCKNTTGLQNTANGEGALFNSITGDGNTAVGTVALFNSTGGGNTAIGFSALSGNTTGSGNIALGAGAGSNIMTANNVICIGTAGADLSGSCFIGNIFGTTSGGGTTVFINSEGQLGTMTSSGRFKEKIKPINKASEAIFALDPVTFHYKKEIDPKGTSQFGLVAEDVEKVNPDLVVRDKEGKPYSVRYDAVNAMLLNEFLKEHRKVEKLEATVAQQHTDFEAAVADLKGQIQKMSVQLEPGMTAPKTVLNDQ